MRRFKGIDGVRDTNKGKLEYIGFTHPLLEHSFAKYMHKHRVMPDGTLRDSNNWWSVWDKHISLDCMIRHLMDLRALEAKLEVFKERIDGEERTHYIHKGEKVGKGWERVSEEDSVNAVKFNCNAYLLDVLKK